MHYCVAIITEDFPTNEVLEKKLAPYKAENFYKDDEEEETELKERPFPDILWDWWTVGGRYCGLIRLKVDEENDFYKWGYYTKDLRSKSLFRSDLLDNINENRRTLYIFDEDYVYGYFGKRYGYLHVDGARIRDIIDFEDTITEHGYVFLGTNGETFVRDTDDEQKYKDDVLNAVKGLEDCYLTFVDIHE